MDIFRLYKDGISACAIARMANRSKQTILYHLKRAGLKIRDSTSVVRVLTDAQERELIKSYRSGRSQQFLHKKFGISTYTVASTLKKHKIKIRGLYAAIHFAPVKLPKPPDVFFYYLLGLLLTDGWVYVRPHSRIFGYGSRDYGNVAFLRNKISPKRKIYRDCNFYRLAVPIDAAYLELLRTWGLCRRKSLILKPTLRLQNMARKSFLQMLVGAIEGDGSVFLTRGRFRQKTGFPTIYLYSTKDFCEYVIGKLGYGRMCKCKSIYRCYWYGAKAVKLAQQLLKCRILKMNRKWNVARAFIK